MSDVPIVQAASQHIYSQFIRHGVRIFEFQERHLHAKTMTVDGLYSWIASYNLDPWSYFYNLEVSMNVINPIITRQLEEQFVRDLSKSTEVTAADLDNKKWHKRLFHWLCYIAVKMWIIVFRVKSNKMLKLDADDGTIQQPSSTYQAKKN